MPRTTKRHVSPPPATRGQRSDASFTLRLPAELAAELAAIATAEGRSRAKQIEMALRQFVQAYRHKSAAE